MKRVLLVILLLIAVAAIFFGLMGGRFGWNSRGGKLIRVSGVTPVGEELSITLTIYDRPLLVTGDQIVGASNEDWLGVYSKLCRGHLLSWDEYKDLVTPEFLKLMPFGSEKEFNEMAIRSREALSTAKNPYPRSIIYTVHLKSKGGDFLYIVTVMDKLLKSLKDGLDWGSKEAGKTVALYRRVDGKWKQENYNLPGGSLIRLMPWKDLEALKALAKSERANVVEGRLHAE